MKPQNAIPQLYLLQVFGTFFLLFYGLGLPILNTDTAWHLAAGDYMRETLSFPRTNMWSFTAPENIWYNLAWCWDILISFLLDKTGAKGLFVFLCSWQALIAAFLAYHLKQRNMPPSAIYIALALLLLIQISIQWSRPQSFSILMIAIFYHVLHQSRKGNEKSLLIGLPLAMVLWVNTHGGYIAAFFFYGAYGLEALLKRDHEWFKTLFYSGLLCLAATLINPYGPYIWVSVYENYMDSFTPYISEWKPYLFTGSSGADIFLILLLLVSNFRDRTLPLADKLLCVFWVVMALLSKRYFTVAVIASAPLLAAGLKQFVPAKQKLKLATARSPLAAAALVLMFALLSVIPFHAWTKRNLMINEWQLVPVNALKFMREHYPQKKFMNDYSWGGFMIYYNRGINPVFIDGRARTAYPEKVMSQMSSMQYENLKVYLEMAKQYHADGAMLYSGSYFIEQNLLPANWKQVYKDDVASIYIIQK